MSRTIYEPIRKKVEEWLWYDENQPSGNYFANVEAHDRFRSLHDRETIRSVGDISQKYVFLLPERQLNCARARKPYYDYVPVMLLEAFPGGAFSSYWDSPEAYLRWIDEEHMEVFFDGGISPEHIRDLSGSGDVHDSLAPLDKIHFSDEDELSAPEKTIRLLEYLKKHTDKEHPLPQSQWRIVYDGYVKLYGEDEEGFSGEDDSDERGEDREKFSNLYYVSEFFYEEIDALIEVVQLSRTLSEEETEHMISTLEDKFTSEHYRKGARRVCKINGNGCCDRDTLREKIRNKAQAMAERYRVSPGDL